MYSPGGESDGSGKCSETLRTAMRYLVWDFDGTLGFRAGQWSGALVSVLKREFPRSSVTSDEIRPHLQTGFPWHTPHVPCAVCRTAEEWWDRLTSVFERAFKLGAGLSDAQAARLASLVRPEYTNPDSWQLFEDTLPTLNALADEGWRHIVLSNHVPELDQILISIGLSQHLQAVFNSARTGLEKPNPQCFRQVSSTLPSQATCIMVGDNVAADIKGARSVGWPAILVRGHHPEAPFCCQSLSQLSQVLSDGFPRAGLSS